MTVINPQATKAFSTRSSKRDLFRAPQNKTDKIEVKCWTGDTFVPEKLTSLPVVNYSSLTQIFKYFIFGLKSVTYFKMFFRTV